MYITSSSVAFLTSAGAAFGIVFISFVFAYAVLSQLARRDVPPPPFCDGWDGSFNPLAQLAYTLPGEGTSVLLTSNTEFAEVVLIDPA